MAGELFGFTSKKELLTKAERFWNPGKTRFWTQSGVPLVIGRREGYVLHDVGGKRLIDMHLNGGTYNLGHRNPEIVAAVTQAMALLRHRQPPLPLGRQDRAGAGPRRHRA